MAAFTIRLYIGQAIPNHCKFENKNMCDWTFIK